VYQLQCLAQSCNEVYENSAAYIRYFLVLASKALEKGRKTDDLRSESVSVINLQTLKPMLNSAQNAPLLLLKLKFSGGQTSPPLCLLNSSPLANTSGSATALHRTGWALTNYTCTPVLRWVG